MSAFSRQIAHEYEEACKVHDGVLEMHNPLTYVSQMFFAQDSTGVGHTCQQEFAYWLAFMATITQKDGCALSNSLLDHVGCVTCSQPG